MKINKIIISSGSWFNDDYFCGVSYRYWSYAVYKYNGFGFRITKINKNYTMKNIIETINTEISYFDHEKREEIVFENIKFEFEPVTGMSIYHTTVAQVMPYIIDRGFELPKYHDKPNIPITAFPLVAEKDAPCVLDYLNWLNKKHYGFEPFVYFFINDDWWLFLHPECELEEYFSIPTQAHWEYAAKGAHLSKGYEYAGSNDIDKVAWYFNNSKKMNHPHEVGLKEPNELGLYDMSGNVWDMSLKLEDSENFLDLKEEESKREKILKTNILPKITEEEFIKNNFDDYISWESFKKKHL